MGLDLVQFREHVVVPALDYVGLYSKVAERLVVGTALVESYDLQYIQQLGNGPARGLFQMEPDTHEDIWGNYLRYRPDLADKVRALMQIGRDGLEQLYGNLDYQAAMCRVHYFRKSQPLPDEDDLEGLARYWKDHYNTRLGAGTIDGFRQKAHVVMAF